MNGSTAVDLRIGAAGWLLLSLVGCLTLFFKFRRFWSVRNLDLVLLFVLAPGLLRLVGTEDDLLWAPYAWLFAGMLLWLARCLIDLGLTRRPIVEPNLNASGLACLALGVLGLLVAETVSLPAGEEAVRNPADPPTKARQRAAAGAPERDRAVQTVLDRAPLPNALRRQPPRAALTRVLAGLGHLGLVAALVLVGWRHFERPIAGLAVAACYLIVPYTRIALVDCGQILPAALIVWALVWYTRPAAAGVLIGLAAGWMPACLGLLPLWAGFYRRRGAWRFALASVVTVVACALLGGNVPGLALLARDLGARRLSEVGLVPGVESPSAGSFWTGIDPSYRLPVQIAYLAFVAVTAVWPAEKNLGELIALSAALLVASQFWYLEQGGTLILLYLPLILLMMFRPNLASKRPIDPPPRASARQDTVTVGG